MAVVGAILLWKATEYKSTLSRFRSLDQRKFTPDVFLAGDFLVITTFDNLHERMEALARESQHNNVKISLNTSGIESCMKTNFSQVAHPLNFSKNNFALLKARPNSNLSTADLVFSLQAQVVFLPAIFQPF